MHSSVIIRHLRENLCVNISTETSKQDLYNFCICTVFVSFGCFRNVAAMLLSRLISWKSSHSLMAIVRSSSVRKAALLAALTRYFSVVWIFRSWQDRQTGRTCNPLRCWGLRSDHLTSWPADQLTIWPADHLTTAHQCAWWQRTKGKCQRFMFLWPEIALWPSSNKHTPTHSYTHWTFYKTHTRPL